MKKLGLRNIESIGAPFLYALSRSKQSKEINRVGTVVFPQHLRPGDEVFSSSLSKLRDLVSYTERNCKPPFLISIPTFDGRFRYDLSSYLREGWSCISFGTRTSSNFLYNFIGAVSSAESVVVETTSSTAYYYALYLGANVRILDDRTILEANACYPYCPERRIRPEISHLVTKSHLNIEEAKFLSATVLGLSELRSPEYISELTGINSALRQQCAKILKLVGIYKYGTDAFNGLNDDKICEVRGERGVRSSSDSIM